MSSDYPRTEIDTADEPPGRLRRWWDTLQDTSRQAAESVARSATLKTVSGDVEDIDPPEDIDEFVELYYGLGFIRKNINEFVDDVIAPGVRVIVDDEVNDRAEQTEAYFMGGDAAPDGAPDGGFLAECFVFDERRQPFAKGLEIAVRDRWVRGTVLVEYLKDDPEDPDSMITGFKFIRPETVSARTYEHTTQLIAPDDTEAADLLTPRDEAAAYVQFDEESILGRRTGRDLFTRSETSIPLSQNDVLKLVLDQDIGGTDPEDGVFGESIIQSVKDDATEYQSMKRDLAAAVKGKAAGLWTLQMTADVIEAGDHVEIVEWGDDDINAAESEVDDLGPGDALTTDANIDLERHDGEVPDLEWTLKHYARDIVDPLPAPFYKHSHADEINQFVTEDQQEDYQERITSEQQYQARQWEQAFREVARRHDDLEPEGLRVEIEPDEDVSPVLSLDTETIEKMHTYAQMLNELSGKSDPTAVFDQSMLAELIAQLPEDEEMETLGGAADLDEADEQVQAQMERLLQAQAD